MGSRHLRLLSLDGGGVRGLSELMILQQLMTTIDPQQASARPCDYFDMIGGTSTGGIIAIMLGRLRMTIEECIEAYLSLSSQVFEKKSHRVSLTGKVQGRFDDETLKAVVVDTLVKRGLSADELLQDSSDGACKVFVCATSKQTRDSVHLTSYPSPRGGTHLFHSAKIWEACRATSAATSFFGPIAIGPYGEEFIDGALGANNPVYALWSEAQDVWGAAKLQQHLKCLVSIGTGKPALIPFADSMLEIGRSLIALATETEATAERFHRDKSDIDDEGRYFRFNVGQGLENIGLEESMKKPEIAAATGRYISSQDVFKRIKSCAHKIAGEESVTNVSNLPYRPAQEHPIMQAYPQLRGSPFEATLAATGNTTPLHKACRKGDAEAVLSLLKAGGHIEAQDIQGQTPLQLAINCKHYKVVETLIEAGASVDAQSRMSKEAALPLTLAVAAKQEDMVRLLVEKGDADINERAVCGWLPLVEACRLGLSSTATYLVDRGADVEKKDGVGRAALLVAAATGHVEITKMLLDHKADLETIMPKNNCTPLLVAVMNGHEETAKLLLEHGARTEQRSNQNSTALFLAIANGSDRLVILLLQYGAATDARCGRLKVSVRDLAAASKKLEKSTIQLVLQKTASQR